PGAVKIRELNERRAPWRYTALDGRGFVRRRDDAAAKRLHGRGDGKDVVLGKARVVVNIHEKNHVCRHSNLLVEILSVYSPRPNAAPQLLPEAGAQRTLEAVSCRRLFGQAVLSALWLDGAHTCISQAVSHLPSFSRGQLQGIATSRSSDFLTSRLPGPLARGWKADRSDVMLAPAPCARRLPASSLRLPVPGQL